MVEAGERVFAHSFGGYWEDVGTLATYYRANLDLLRADARLALDDPAWPILTRDEERPPVLVLPGADLAESLVANGCRVAGRVRQSVVFPGVTVEPGAEVVSERDPRRRVDRSGARLDRRDRRQVLAHRRRRPARPPARRRCADAGRQVRPGAGGRRSRRRGGARHRHGRGRLPRQP